MTSGIWQVELRIPSDVRGVLGRTRFAQSTVTRDKPKASNRALPVLTEWQLLKLRVSGLSHIQICSENVMWAYLLI